MQILEVTYPITFIIELDDDVDATQEEIAESFQNTIGDWLDSGGTVWPEALEINPLDVEA